MSTDLKSENYKESYGGSEWSNQLLTILLSKMFSNHSDFCFHITIHEILDKKCLYGEKKFISEKKKKSLLKILKKNKLFSKSLLRNFSLTFLEYTKNGGNDPLILTPCNSVSVAT